MARDNSSKTKAGLYCGNTDNWMGLSKGLHHVLHIYSITSFSFLLQNQKICITNFSKPIKGSGCMHSKAMSCTAPNIKFTATFQRLRPIN